MSDALSALRTALAPKGGMRRIPFPLESYEHPSLPLSAKRLLNLMAEQAPADARTAAALVSTPTLQPYLTVGTGPILAMNDEQPGVIYVVSGTKAYRITFSPLGVPTTELLADVGTANAGTSPRVAGGASPTSAVTISPLLRVWAPAAAAAGATTPMGAAAAQIYALHNAWGEGGTDFSGIIHVIRGKSG
jgi:hypothetical protein